jgi:hypothetical protein
MDQKQQSNSTGDARTPDKPIGEVAYAERDGKQQETSKQPPKDAERSSLEGPAAYAPHDPDEKIKKRE